MPPSRLSSGFSILGTGDSNTGNFGLKNDLLPSLKLVTDKELYRPGDSVDVSIEISNPVFEMENSRCSLLLEKLSFELKGIEKLDTQWFTAQKSLPGSKQKRGAHVFLDGRLQL